MTGRRLRRLAVRGGIGLLLLVPFLAIAALYPVLREQPLLASVEAATLDWRYRLRGPRVPKVPVSVVMIDDATVRAHGGWPLRRDVLAQAITRLSEFGVAAITVDLILADPGRDPQEDAALAAAVADSGRVALAVALRFGRGGADRAGLPDPVNDRLGWHTIPLLSRRDAPSLPEPIDALAPIARLENAAAALGHVNVILGRDGALRHLYPVLPVDGLALPALSVSGVRLFAGVARDDVLAVLPEFLQIGHVSSPLDADGRWTLNFYGPEGSFPTYSLHDLIAGRVPRDVLAGRIVWVGASATGVGDAFVTPYDPVLPGVEAFATATANLLENGFLVRNAVTSFVDMLAVVVVGATTLLIALALPAGLAVALSAIPLLSWIGVTIFAFSTWNVWLTMTIPALAGLAAGMTVGCWRLLLTDSRRRRLAGYLPTPLAEALADADQPSFAERRQMVAVLFADLSGFTAQSETATPDGTAALLRSLHGVLEEAAAAHGGYVDSFSGDGGMLVFGVPEPGPRDALRALSCAFDLLRRGAAASMTLRVGLHAGEVQVARLGGRQHRQLTLAGDTVNLASRLMEVAKAHGASLALSETVAVQVRAVGGEALLAGLEQRVGVEIRGRQGRVDLWLARSE